MSGRKHHFIPRMLLRAFGQPKGKSTQVRVMRHGDNSFVSSIEGVAAERDFYALFNHELPETALDDQITDFENFLDTDLKKLLSAQIGEFTDAKCAARVVCHLAIRNNHFRRAVSDAAFKIFDKFIATLSREDSAKSALGFNGATPSPSLSKILKEHISETSDYRKLGLTEDKLEKQLFEIIKSNFGAAHQSVIAPAQAALSEMLSNLSDVAADAQKKALLKSLAPDLRLEELETFEWRIVEDVTQSLALPDCGPVSWSSVKKYEPYLLASKEETAHIYLPISHCRILIGDRDDPKKVDLKYLNKHLAECAWDFMITHPKNENADALSRRIRKKVSMTIDNLVQKTHSEFLHQ